MEKLCFISALVCVLGAAHSNEIDVNLCSWDEENKAKYAAMRMAEPEEERFQRDRDEWEGFCVKGRPLNKSDLTATTAKLRNAVIGDPAAIGAMDIFFDSDYWKLVDYCADNLKDMNEINHQRFRDVLILLTPGLVSSRYMAKVVNLVCTDQRDVRAADIKHLPFCLDMFFYGAVRNGQQGRYAFAMLCLDAFCAPCLDCENDKRFDA
ncbi:MAG: hypothetical protein LBR89_03270, partial [Holosporales bacterium]|nr:hypothetical protein [Holosporales bacterium]